MASTTLSTERAHALLEPLLTQGQTEAKYRRLKSSGKGQKALVNFFASAELELESTCFTVIDRRFYLTAQMVDKLIEPTLHDAGLDLYARDAHVGLSNVCFYAGQYIFPDGGWERLQRAFLEAIRVRTPEMFAQLDAVLAEVAAKSNLEYSDLSQVYCWPEGT